MVNVDSGGEVVIPLPGFDAAGRPLFAAVVSPLRVTSAGGGIFQLSSTFSAYGYPPAQGAAILSASSTAPVRVTGSRARLVFAAPAGAAPASGPWATFQYVVSDGAQTSPPGTVWVLPLHRRVAWSDFTDGAGGWVIADNGSREAALPSGGATWEALSRGPLLNHYLLGSDAAARVTVHCGDYRALMFRLRQDVVFFDPPWGGPQYRDAASLDMFLGDSDVADIAVALTCAAAEGQPGAGRPYARFVAIKAPVNYNVRGLEEALRRGGAALAPRSWRT